MNKIKWSYYNKFNDLIENYLPERGEGETVANQLVTAVTKLIYKWYNDGDVYDNTGKLEGWVNDLSSYANWIGENIEGAKDILNRIYTIQNEDEYEYILKKLADTYLRKDILNKYNSIKKNGSIYSCKGQFKYDFRRRC